MQCELKLLLVISVMLQYRFSHLPYSAWRHAQASELQTEQHIEPSEVRASSTDLNEKLETDSCNVAD